MNEQIKQLIKSIELGEPKRHNNMLAFPPFTPTKSKLNYLSLGEAIRQKLAEVTEVSEHGSVPTLMVINHSDQPILIIDGEELAGAKQNRIVNTTLLLDAKTKTLIPVSCTEQGRWSYTSKKFDDSGIIMSSVARCAKNVKLNDNLSTDGEYKADQGMVWDCVIKLNRSLGVNSPTGAMKDSFEKRKEHFDDYAKSFALEAGQKGILVFLNGLPGGFDLISGDDAYAKLHDKFVKSYAADALASPGKVEEKDYQIEGYKFVHSLLDCSESLFKPIGIGEDYRYTGKGIIGAALKLGDEVLHLNAARTDDGFSKRKDKEGGDFFNRLHRTPHPNIQRDADASSVETAF